MEGGLHSANQPSSDTLVFCTFALLYRDGSAPHLEHSPPRAGQLQGLSLIYRDSVDPVSTRLTVEEGKGPTWSCSLCSSTHSPTFCSRPGQALCTLRFSFIKYTRVYSRTRTRVCAVTVLSSVCLRFKKVYVCVSGGWVCPWR